MLIYYNHPDCITHNNQRVITFSLTLFLTTLVTILLIGCLGDGGNNNQNQTPQQPETPDGTRDLNNRLLTPDPLTPKTLTSVSYTISQNGSCAANSVTTQTGTQSTNQPSPCPSPTNFNNRLAQVKDTVLLAGAKVSTTWKLNFSSSEAQQLRGVLDPATNHKIQCNFTDAAATCTNIFTQPLNGTLSFKIYSKEHCEYNTSITTPATSAKCADLTQYPSGTYLTKTVGFEIIDVGAQASAQQVNIACATSGFGNEVAKATIENPYWNIFAQGMFAVINTQQNCPQTP